MTLRFILFALLMLTGLVGCQNATPSPLPVSNVTRAAPRVAERDEWVIHQGLVDLRLRVPAGWETYNTNDGIVLSEHVSSAYTADRLRGILVHLFVPPMDGFSMSGPDANLAWAVLKQVVTNPAYVGDALASEPVAFDWDDHHAAYYLLNNRDGTLTLLLALGLAGRDQIVVCHISLPETQQARRRPLLPQLLAGLTVDGAAIDASALHDLPDPLVFPAPESNG